MGAIICKVAAVAPGNDLKVASVCVCVCVRVSVCMCVLEHAARVCLLLVITSPHLQ